MVVTGAAAVSNLKEESNGWRNGGEQEEQGWGREWVVPEEKQLQEETLEQPLPLILLVYLLLGRGK